MIQVELTNAARDDLLRLREQLRARHGEPLSGEFAELADSAMLLAVQRAAIDALGGLRDNPGQEPRTTHAPGAGTSSTVVTSTSIVTATAAAMPTTSASKSSTGSS